MSFIRSFVFPAFLFLVVSVAPLRLCADAIASVGVRTDTTNLPGGSACSLSSSGAAIQCTSGETGVPIVAQASGSASAAFGLVSAAIAADGPPPHGSASAIASADASYSYQVILPTAPPGEEVFGFYRLAQSNNLNAFFQDGLIRVSQGSASNVFSIANGAGTFLLDSPYVAGQLLDISASIQAETVGPGGSMSATVQLVGFTDGAGNPIPFTIVPEPAGWPVLGLCLLL